MGAEAKKGFGFADAKNQAVEQPCVLE